MYPWESWRLRRAAPIVRKAALSVGRSVAGGLLLALALGCSLSQENRRTFVLPPGSRQADRIVVACDDNYPPYAFRNSKGTLEGIVPDLWAAWSRKTGIKAEVRAMAWSSAIAMFESGEADVLDTVFQTPARELKYLFTAPYARIDVPLFIHKSISGIASLSDLGGFRIGAKKGDAAIETLQQNGLRDLVLFDNYKDIIEEAANLNIRVFTIDKPPALYLLYKEGLDRDFRVTFSLGSGEFHRAVRKASPGLLALVQDGFAAIPAKDAARIDERWLGTEIMRGLDRRLIRGVGLFALAMVIVLLGLAWTLRVQVRRATAALREKVTLLEESDQRHKTSLAEKEVLLKEIHHRVKNNMQVISSLIQLQSYEIKDEDDREMLRETQERIRAMAQLHELLYRSHDLSSVDAGTYLTGLVDELAAGHDFAGLACSADSSLLELDSAVPLGLIANELVLNALKHAYPGLRSGRIDVSFRVQDEECVLTVRDQGRGLLASVDPSSCPSMGLTLVRSLADQIRGRLAYQGPPGFGVELRFTPR
jgi:two-component sensor histidine kinase/ABC-type amino acid transport substrate-binding protein